MNADQINNVVNNRCHEIKRILTKKAGEYATDSDRFHNFHVAARIVATTPERALKGMMLKHEVSVADLIDWADSDPEKLTDAMIDEKVGDNINYLILLEGMLKDRVARRMVQGCPG